MPNLLNAGMKSALGALALALLTGSAAVAQGNGTIKPYDLGLMALMNADDSVDLYVDVNVKPDYQASFTVPTLSKRIQFKSFDLEGKLRWTKNYQDELLTANAENTSSWAMFSFDDMVYRQPVKAEVQVQDNQTTNTEVLRGLVNVQWRPDPALTAIEAPGEVPVGALFDVTVTVNEINKDLGVTADIVLYDGSAELMRMPGADIDPAGPTVVKFQDVSLSSVGHHTLMATIENADPGDFDAANNSMDVVVTASSGVTTTAFTVLEYVHRDYRVVTEWDTSFSKGFEERTYLDTDSMKIQIAPGTDTITFPVNFKYTLEVDELVFATDELLNLPGTLDSLGASERYSSTIAPGQNVLIISWGALYPDFEDFAEFQNLAYTNIYEVRMEDTDGDGVLETIFDRQSGSFGTPVAMDSPPSSVGTSLELTTGGITYIGAVTASGAEISVECPLDWEVEMGTRGVNYTSTSTEYQQCFEVRKTN